LITHPALGAKEKVRVLAQGSQRKRFSCRVAAWFNNKLQADHAAFCGIALSLAFGPHGG
jgi:hypothetical protein